MEERFIFNSIRIWRRIITQKPIFFIAMVISGLLTAISVNLVFMKTGSLTLLFATKPEILISIENTEEYEIESNKLIIQRIKISNKFGSIRNIKISINLPTSLKETIFVSEPDVQFRTSRFKDDAGNVLIEIMCDSFVQNQTAEIRLILNDLLPKSESSNIVVEFIGTYGRDKLIGTSTTGTLLLKSSEN